MATGPMRYRSSVGSAFRRLVLWTSAAESAVATSPSVTSGSGAPSASEPNGSIYLRTGGAAATTLYARVSGAWAALSAGVLPSSSVFFSVEQTGTGSEQIIAHGLVTTPALVFVIASDITGGAFTVAYGTHDATDTRVTVTSGEKFRVVAFK